MSYVPDTLQAARLFIREQTGLSLTALGVVGGKSHTRGYHLGKDRIYDGDGPGVGDADYSVQLPRDKAGLTNAASALDIGNFPRLRELSLWLVGQARAGAPGTKDIRHIIYSPDGESVYTWDGPNERVVRAGDSTHRWHTHIGYYRDSEKRDKTDLFRRFFLPDTATEDDMRGFTFIKDATGRFITRDLVVDDEGVRYLDFDDGKTKPLSKGTKKYGVQVRLKDPIVAGKPRTDDWMLGYLVGDDGAFLLARNVTATTPPNPQAAALAARLDTVKKEVAASAERVRTT